MKKKNIKPLILSALTAAAMAGVTVGGTFALFTDKAETTVQVASGKVQVQSNISAPVLTSALADPSGTMIDENGNHYTTQDGWVNGGSASVDADGKISLSKMTPGDRAVIAAAFTNESTVAIKYRVSLKANDPASFLAAGLKVSIAGNEYQGLLSYESEWIYMAIPQSASEKAVDLGSISFFMPIDAGNVLQDLSTAYTLRIEFVQGNASVSGEEKVEVATYVPQAQVVTSNAANFEFQTANSTSDETKTTVALDFTGTSAAASEGDVVNLGVNTSNLLESNSAFVANDEGNAAAIDLKLYVNDAQTTSTEGFKATITSYIAKNLGTESGTGNRGVFVNYDTTDTTVAFHDGGTRVYDVVDLDQPGEFMYDRATGKLTFITDHFSEYVVNADNIVAYNKNSAVVYTSFIEALNEATPLDVLALKKDIDLTSPSLYVNNRISFAKSLVVEGENHVISLANRGFGLTGQKVTFKNVTIENNTSSGRCIDTRGTITELNLDNVVLSAPTAGAQPLTIGGNNANICKVNITNSVIRTKADGSYGYAIISFNPIDVVMKNSTVAGWTCFNMKSPDGSAGSAGSTIKIENSQLISKNVYSGESNAFSVFKIEDNDIDVDVKDTRIQMIGASNYENLFSFQKTGNYYSENNTLSFDRCVLSYRGQGHLGYLATNTLTFKDVTLDIEDESQALFERNDGQELLVVENADGSVTYTLVANA